jgi:3-oxoacyl-[acyl-carrier protein] reductase
MTFTGKNLLVTGGSRGIGAEIAKLVAKYGVKVWINYRSNGEQAEKVKREIEEAGGKAGIIQFDVSKPEEFVEGIKTIVELEGRLDYLVNNAGITKDKLAIRMGVEEFEEVIRVNLTSTFVGCREALKIMSRQRFGAVVNISSVVGERGNLGQVNYSASKGGIIALTKSFALEGAGRGVRFNVVTPGFIATDMTSSLPEKVKGELLKNIPLKRLGSPAEVAGGVAFLLSDMASYITGEVLKINGGLYI